jgi:hypothetical protein
MVFKTQPKELKSAQAPFVFRLSSTGFVCGVIIFFVDIWDDVTSFNRDEL